MEADKKEFISPEEYLQKERLAEFKSEYYIGEVFAFARTSLKHSFICGNILANLHTQLDEGECSVLSSDIRIWIKEQDVFTYPDITIYCGEPELLDAELDTLLNPVVIFEVLSKSTEGYDRGLKFSFYRKLDSLEEYILVAQDRVSVEHYIKSETGEWILREYESIKDEFLIKSVGCKLKLADVYNKIEFDGRIDSLLIREEAAQYYTRSK